MCHARFGVTALGLLLLVACSGTLPADTASPFAVSTPSSTTTPAAAIAPNPTATPPPATLGVPAGVAMPSSRLTPGATFIGVTAAEVCTLGGIVMAVITLLAPATRIGYLLYPINFFVWSYLFRDIERAEEIPERALSESVPA